MDLVALSTLSSYHASRRWSCGYGREGYGAWWYISLTCSLANERWGRTAHLLLTINNSSKV